MTDMLILHLRCTTLCVRRCRSYSRFDLVPDRTGVIGWFGNWRDGDNREADDHID